MAICFICGEDRAPERDAACSSCDLKAVGLWLQEKRELERSIRVLAHALLVIAKSSMTVEHAQRVAEKALSSTRTAEGTP